MTPFLVSLALFILAGVLWLWGVVLPRRRKNKAGEPAMETYGFSESPLEFLRARLPTLPGGYCWESYVKHDEKGCPWLHLGLFDLVEWVTLETRRRNLRWRTPPISKYKDPGQRWVERMEKMNEHWVLRNELLENLIEWADETARKKRDEVESCPGRVDDYKLT